MIGLFLMGLAAGAGWVARGSVAVHTWQAGYHDGLTAADSAIHALEARPPVTPGGVPVWRAIFDR